MNMRKKSSSQKSECIVFDALRGDQCPSSDAFMLNAQEVELRSYELKSVKLQNCRCLRSLQMPSYTSQVIIPDKDLLIVAKQECA